VTGDGVGRVLGSEHSSTSEFRVVLDDDEYLQLDDLIVVRTQVPKAGEVATYGVVTEAESVYEGAMYESDTHRVAELGIMPAAKVRSARVAVTRVDPEIWVSPDPGEIVQRATGDERAKALYLDEMGRPLPIGRYELRFAVARYFAERGVLMPDPPFLDEIPLRFAVSEPEAHYHVLLLVTPWSYSTYRGS